MRYGSVCSGIEAATVAWHPLGWKPAFFSEIDPFPRAVLAHHYPTVPLHGDFTTIIGDEYEAIDLLVGGTPCQAFSIAGLRQGFSDDRGNLTLEFVRLAQRTRARWLVWENVPGVLSIDGGRAFGAFLGALAQCGYGFAYRVLDAQYFGVPQRRRRVFVIGYFGDWRPAAAVLFERESLRGDITPSRETREDVAKCLTTGVGTRLDAETDTFITYKAAQPIAFGVGENSTVAHCLRSAASKAYKHEPTSYVVRSMSVRRLTPIECERLQGFPDNYTLIPYRGKPAADTPRYKALGNSMAVPVMRWIGERINLADELVRKGVYNAA